MSSELLKNASISDIGDALIRADVGGEIILSGESHFGSGTLNVTKRVTIRGELDAERPIIYGGGSFGGGTIVFPALEIKAPGVTIQHLHFSGPQVIAIRAAEVNGVIIRDCKIEGLQVPAGLSTGSAIIVGTMFPNPRTALGNIQVVGNEIDTVGGPTVGTAGILFNQAGIAPDGTAQILVQANTVKSVTGFGIDFRDLKGHATVARNTIDMGTQGSQGVQYPSAIRCFGSSPKDPCEGQYEVFENMITCGIDRGAGIRIYSASTFAPIGGAKASFNEITMLTPNDLINDKNAGIEVRGIVLDTVVSGNTIAGRARAAFSVIEDPNGAPVATKLTDNHHPEFRYLLADICIGARASNTQITAPKGQKGRIQDLDKSEFSKDSYEPI